jgi:hypothetical protein
MEKFMEYLPFLLPLFILELILALAAVVHILRHNKFRFGNKWLWIPIVLLIQIIGPVLYFAIGRGED